MTARPEDVVKSLKKNNEVDKMKAKLNENVFEIFCDKVLKNEDDPKKQFWYDPKDEKCYYTNGEKPSQNAICIVENINNPEWRLDRICHRCSSTQKECEKRIQNKEKGYESFSSIEELQLECCRNVGLLDHIHYKVAVKLKELGYKAKWIDE